MLKFSVSGKVYEIDLDPAKLMGDELLLLDDLLPAGWAERWAQLQLGPRDIITITYLAAKRGGDERPFDEFVKTIAPLTFKIVDDEAKPAPADAIGPKVRARRKSD